MNDEFLQRMEQLRIDSLLQHEEYIAKHLVELPIKYRDIFSVRITAPKHSDRYIEYAAWKAIDLLAPSLEIRESWIVELGVGAQKVEGSVFVDIENLAAVVEVGQIGHIMEPLVCRLMNVKDRSLAVYIVGMKSHAAFIDGMYCQKTHGHKPFKYRTQGSGAGHNLLMQDPQGT